MCRTQEHYSETFKVERGYKDYKVRHRTREENENKDERNFKYFAFIVMVFCIVVLCNDYREPNFYKKEKPTK